MVEKFKCALLREIRKEIAESNGIVYLTKECLSSKTCSGECEITKAETRYLEAELKRNILEGKELKLDGIKLERFSSIQDYTALGAWPCMVKLGVITMDDIYDMPLEELELSVRSFNCLRRAGIHDVRDLISITDSQLMVVRNLGRKSYEEVHQRLNLLGLSLKSEYDSSFNETGESLTGHAVEDLKK